MSITSSDGIETADLDAIEITRELRAVRDRAATWLRARRNPHGPGFSLYSSSELPVELNATTCGVELWTMLGLPLSQDERSGWIDHLASYQRPHTGLVVDPTWRSREPDPRTTRTTDGDTFFTMTTVAAAEALSGHLPHPVAYLAQLSVRELAEATTFGWVAHNPFGVGDYGRLIRHNNALNVDGADELWSWTNRMVLDAQDETGLWARGNVSPPLTPAINRTFHVLRSTWNLTDEPIRFADRMIDACLAAEGDEDFYGWEFGYACNDLDLAHVAYSASRWTEHRRDELAAWARRALKRILRVEHSEGGFSFYHETTMLSHAGITMSSGLKTADMWGTVMYLGAIKMMVEIGWPGTHAPWGFSQVHAVPTNGGNFDG